MDPRTLVDLALEDLGLSNLFRHFRDKRVSVDEIVKAVDEAYSVSLVPESRGRAAMRERYRKQIGREPTEVELETYMGIEGIATIPGELPPDFEREIEESEA